MRITLIFLFFMAGCAPEGFPDDPVFSDPATLERPEIVPLDPIFEAASEENATANTQAELADRGGSLRARAEALRGQTDAAAQEGAGGLRERAETLRRQSP